MNNPQDPYRSPEAKPIEPVPTPAEALAICAKVLDAQSPADRRRILVALDVYLREES